MPNKALQPTPGDRVRAVRRVPALGGILREGGAAERQAVDMAGFCQLGRSLPTSRL
jgi:hypothetical protein